jgi:hypothetical protein
MPLRVRALIVIALLGTLALACQKPASPNKPSGGASAAAGTTASADPLKDAIVTYLTKSKGMDMAKMEIALSNQKIEGDKATCDAAFTVKGAEGMPPMEYTYELAKAGDAWKVTSSKGKGGGHAGGAPPSGDMPAGHPAMGGEAPGMPPGHPGMSGDAGMSGHGTGASPGMPAGHPDVSDLTKGMPAQGQPQTQPQPKAK